MRRNLPWTPIGDLPSPLPDRILVVRLSAMGDIIHGMPAIAALRRAKPDLKIGWLVEAALGGIAVLPRSGASAAALAAQAAGRLGPRGQLLPLAAGAVFR